jgi:hypothetical protein
VLFLDLASSNTFKQAYVVFLNRAGATGRPKLTNLTMRTEEKRSAILIGELPYTANDIFSLGNESRERYRGMREFPSVYYLSMGWYDASCLSDHDRSKSEQQLGSGRNIFVAVKKYGR